MTQRAQKGKDDHLYPELSYAVIGAAIEVHRTLGPGFPEMIYQAALERELGLRGIRYEAQKMICVEYRGVIIGEYFLDLVVNDQIVLELKAVKEFSPLHESQAISYLKASGLRLCLLFNFGQTRLQTKRIVL